MNLKYLRTRTVREPRDECRECGESITSVATCSDLSVRECGCLLSSTDDPFGPPDAWYDFHEESLSDENQNSEER